MTLQPSDVEPLAATLAARTKGSTTSAGDEEGPVWVPRNIYTDETTRDRSSMFWNNS